MVTPPVEKHPFQPFLPEGARILFLGSFPPQPHRWCMPFYYPNWINDFWRIMGLIHFGDKNHFCIPAEKRFDEAAIRAFCAEQGLAFYDTACEVRRLMDNASDAFLEVVTPTDIPALLARIPACQHIVVTGEKAAQTLAASLNCTPPPVGSFMDVTLDIPRAFENPRTLETTRTGEGPHAGLDPASPRPLRLWRMPSTSRAYPLPLEKKADAYRQLFHGFE